MAPYLMTGGRWGYRMGNAQIYDSMLHDGLNELRVRSSCLRGISCFDLREP